MDWRDHVTRRPDVLGGKPTLGGTRVTVELVLGLLGDGWSEEEVLAEYPGLTKDQVRAALAYASAALASDDLVFLGPAA